MVSHYTQTPFISLFERHRSSRHLWDYLRAHFLSRFVNPAYRAPIRTAARASADPPYPPHTAFAQSTPNTHSAATAQPATAASASCTGRSQPADQTHSAGTMIALLDVDPQGVVFWRDFFLRSHQPAKNVHAKEIVLPRYSNTRGLNLRLDILAAIPAMFVGSWMKNKVLYKSIGMSL